MIHYIFSCILAKKTNKKRCVCSFSDVLTEVKRNARGHGVSMVSLQTSSDDPIQSVKLASGPKIVCPSFPFPRIDLREGRES